MIENNTNSNTETQVTDDSLSKAIDNLIVEQFGEDLNKGGGQPDNKIDELPKDTDVIANGGKDIYKAHIDDYDKMSSDDKMKYDEKMEKKYTKGIKKSVEGVDIPQIDQLIKSLGEEKQKSENLEKSNEGLFKSFEGFQKSINEKFDNIGEIFKGLKYEIDSIKTTPLERRSIKDVDQIRKSFNQDKDTLQEDRKEKPFTKSEVESAIEDLVKAQEVPSELVTEYEMYSKFHNEHHGKMVAARIMNNRKKAS